MIRAPRILLTVADLSFASGGPARSVPALARGLLQAGVQAEILTLAPADGDEPVTGVPTSFVRAPGSRLRDLRATGPWRDALRARCANGAMDLIHDAGIWLPVNHATASVAAQIGLPRVVSTRGMLEPWAMGHRPVKKNLAWQLYQRRDLDRASLLHTTSDEESANLRAAGLQNPIGQVPNGVEIPEKLERREATSPRRALFLSRIHPKKGLLDLVRAWAEVRPADWKMIVAGPDDGGHLSEVRRAVEAAHLEASFEFTGPVKDADKWDLYSRAELFILPTYSENFGLAIAEALGSGLPVITTRGTPWRAIANDRMGWWIPTGADALAKTLREAIALTRPSLAEMGQRGRQHIATHYSWRPLAERMAAIYSWLLGRGARPDCVDEV